MANMVPMEARQSMLEDPSSGSKQTTYFPWTYRGKEEPPIRSPSDQHSLCKWWRGADDMTPKNDLEQRDILIKNAITYQWQSVSASMNCVAQSLPAHNRLVDTHTRQWRSHNLQIALLLPLLVPSSPPTWAHGDLELLKVWEETWSEMGTLQGRSRETEDKPGLTPPTSKVRSVSDNSF